jgi:hypothetical protein
MNVVRIEGSGVAITLAYAVLPVPATIRTYA